MRSLISGRRDRFGLFTGGSPWSRNPEIRPSFAVGKPTRFYTTIGTQPAAARIPFDKRTVEQRLLGLKDVAALYELWCYFAVIDAVRAVTGRDPDIAEIMDVKVDEVDLGRGFRTAWVGGPTVHYNLSFGRGKAAPRRSASLMLRPDIVIEIERDGQPELHVFDAKLRVDGVASVHDEGEDDESNPLSFKKDDIVKMHAYRDALPHVRSARVLYPGEVSCEFPALEPGARPADAVGATPLVPGAIPTEFVRVLEAILTRRPDR